MTIKGSFLHIVSCFLLLVCLLTVTTLPAQVQLTITDEPVGTLDDRVFGHFFEKCNWSGESGADLAWDVKANTFRSDVVDLMDSLKVTIVRFPGGTDVDAYFWTELIDNAPDRDSPQRPPYDGRNGVVVSNNELGLDEFLELSEQLDFEPLLVTNLKLALFDSVSIMQGAEYAAALLAYCNGQLSDHLPPKYEQYVLLRMKNGRQAPYNVRYFQIGNELNWFDVDEGLRYNQSPLPADIEENYVKTVTQYLQEMKRVDPGIELILEGSTRGFAAPALQHFQGQFSYLAHHIYHPWEMRAFYNAEGEEVALSQEELYYAWIALPGINPSTGFSEIINTDFEYLKEAGVQVAITEWNWNGWLALKNNQVQEEQLVESLHAKGLGAAGFLHAFMRASDHIKIANQSMLVGNSWDINSIRIDDATKEPELFPSGMVTGLYSRYHGNVVLKSELSNNQFYTQPYKVSGVLPAERVALVDLIVTADDKQVYIHAINRHFDKKIALAIQFDAMDLGNSYTHHSISGDASQRKSTLWGSAVGQLDAGQQVTLLPQSVNVLVFDREK
ncbi:alpha-L-arabinofuranosidase C-terminal domain-containing protein [Marinoscillum furvescens]|uniref:non-reducing end alpha-L-arabinofuranosidase n=1 Tax=Marinoscillum furvescens DSM 4134 TaxID=1122208 RepID=A0A3D9L6P3_MARFU|nr:alpha-L-arabinofuranosidase C-terminal domain-containing protein [Marinoscillum furvescens]REE02031.1 alpha-N-arabinofuranosidase [Marinoscillum furvescens DSM 4134]